MEVVKRGQMILEKLIFSSHMGQEPNVREHKGTFLIDTLTTPEINTEIAKLVQGQLGQNPRTLLTTSLRLDSHPEMKDLDLTENPASSPCPPFLMQPQTNYWISNHCEEDGGAAACMAAGQDHLHLMHTGGFGTWPRHSRKRDTKQSLEGRNPHYGFISPGGRASFSS